MRIDREISLPVREREVAWAILRDPSGIVAPLHRSVPEWELAVRHIGVDEDGREVDFRVDGRASGGIAICRGGVAAKLHDGSNSTTLHLAADLAIAGAPRSLEHAVPDALLSAFVEGFQTQLQNYSTEATPSGASYARARWNRPKIAGVAGAAISIVLISGLRRRHRTG